MPTQDHKLSVFLSYTRKDEGIVRELYNQLLQVDWLDVWIDQERIDPGTNWDIEIKKAIETSDAAIVCISKTSVSKEGYIQKELKKILDIFDEKPEGVIYVIPLRLDECEVPRSLSAVQYVDYFPGNAKGRAYGKLINSLKRRANQLEDKSLIAAADAWNKETVVSPTMGDRLTAVIKTKWGVISGGILIFACILFLWSRLFTLFINSLSLFAEGVGPFSWLSTPTLAINVTSSSPFDTATEQPASTPEQIATSIPSEQPVAASTFEFQPGQTKNTQWNQFTAAQVQCMTPTVFPIQGANNVAFLPGGQLLAVDLGEGDEEKIGIWNIQKRSWDKLMNGKLLTQTPYGPMFVRGTDYIEDPTYILLVQDEGLRLTLTNVVVTAFAVSPDGNAVAFGYDDGTIEVIYPDTGKHNTLLGSSSPSEHLVFSPDSSLLASGSHYGANYLWDASAGSLLSGLDQDADTVSFSPDGKEILYKGSYEIKAWNIDSHETRTVLALQNNGVNGLYAAPFLSQDASILVVGNTFWDIPAMTLLRSLNEHGDYTAMVSGSFEGDKLVSVSINEIIVWDLKCSSTRVEPTGSTDFKAIIPSNVDSLKLAHTFDATVGRFALSSNRFVMGNQVYSLLEMQPISDFGDYIFDTMQDIAISPDGKYLVSEKDIGTLSVWDVVNDHWGNILNGCGSLPIFTAEGKLLAINQETKEICIWNTLSGVPQKTHLLTDEIGGSNRGGDIVVMPSGIYQTTHLYDGNKFALFDILTNESNPKYIFPESIEWASFSPGGNYAVTRNLAGNYELSVTGIKNQTVVKDFGFAGGGGIFSFTQDDKLFAILKYEANSKIQFYNTTNWQMVAELEPLENMEAFQFSPDGHFFVISAASKTYFWSVNGL